MKKAVGLITFMLIVMIVVEAMGFTLADYNLLWEVAGNKLTIKVNGSGTGSMPDYTEAEDIPWHGKTFETVVIEDRVQNIGSNAFCGKPALTSITIPGSVKSIGEAAFAQCGLSTVKIPSGVTSIKPYTFTLCKNLKTVSLPLSVKVIDDEAFSNCEVLNNISLPENLTNIGTCSFASCYGLNWIRIPDTVSKIPEGAFINCTSLKDVQLSNSLQQIGYNSFTNCKNLPAVTIPSTVKTIESNAFLNCSNLTKVIIESKNVSFGTDVFKGDSKLTIYGYTGSTAEAYAKANNIPFVALDASPAEPTEKVTLKKLKSVKLKALSAKKLEVKWKKLSKKEQGKIQKIEIQYSTDKSFKTGVKKKWAKKTKNSYTIKGLKKNTKYYVRIRAYKKSGNIIYVSKWVTKNKKTKKK